MLDCFVIKKALFPLYYPVGKNPTEQARIVMMTVSKGLPKKKDLAEHVDDTK